MATGQNERDWQVESYSASPITWDPLTPISNESYAVRKNAPILYYIKEALKNNGWGVVSCSYRTDGFQDTYPTQSLTAYGQNAAPVASDEGVKFYVSDVDMWTLDYNTINYDSGIQNNSFPTLPLIEDLNANELHRLIYPAASCNTGSDIGIVSSSAGRSWCLLSHSGPLNQNGQQLYLVLDYIGVTYLSTNTSTRNSYTSSVATITAQSLHFGKAINVAAFYGEPQNIPDSPTAMSPNYRPYRNDEIRFSKFISGSGNYNDWNSITNYTILETPHITHVYNNYSGSYTIVSEAGAPSFVLGIDLIADNISSSLSSKESVGNVVFMSFSAYNRNGINRSDSSALSDLFCKARYQNYNGQNAIDDSWFRPIKYFKTVMTEGNYVPGSLISTYPAYGLTSRISDSPQGFLSVTATNTSTTFDGTYVEYPLPLLDIDTTNNKVRYAGRFADVKLGPASGINGATARTGELYDRVLIGGLWFPYSGSSGPEL